MAMPLDESFSAYNLQRLRTADTLLLGRTTFVGFRSGLTGSPELRRMAGSRLARRLGVVFAPTDPAKR